MQEAYRPTGDVALGALALGAFALAMWLSYRGVQDPNCAMLLTPGVLLVDCLLAVVLGLGYAAREHTLGTWLGLARCLAYGLWSAAVFRLVPVMPTEGVLFYSNHVSPDAPFILVAAVGHGVIALVFISALAVHLFRAEGRARSADDEQAWYLGVATILAFFIVAGVVRLASAQQSHRPGPLSADAPDRSRPRLERSLSFKAEAAGLRAPRRGHRITNRPRALIW